jgi:hypothetical protein
MKSQQKVKQQRRIKVIPAFCDNPIGKEGIKLQDLVKKGVIVITKPQPRKVVKPVYRKINRTSN